MNIIVTGGAGFIGSADVRQLIYDTDHQLMNLDRLTCYGNTESLATFSDTERYQFSQTDIFDRQSHDSVFAKFHPDIIMNLAAEGYVDRSIEDPVNSMLDTSKMKRNIGIANSIWELGLYETFQNENISK